MAEAKNGPTEIRLHCLQGGAAKPEIVQGWKEFLNLPDAAAASIWSLLEPALLDPTNPENQSRVELFCAEHDVEGYALGAATLTCVFLVDRASTLDLGAENLRKDLLALSGDASDRISLIADNYEKVKPYLRNRIIEETLADHGNVLTGLDWRVDQVSTSDRGANLDANVIFLTLRYRNAGDGDSLSLQLTPRTLDMLRSFMARFDGPTG